MKKLLSLSLCVLILIGTFILPVSAQSIDISDEIFNVIKNDNPNHVSDKDDVDFRYIKELTGGKYLVRYTIADSCLSCDVPHIDIGRYIFISSRPLPEVYCDGKLYEIEEAYDIGKLTKEDLELMDSFSELDFEKTKISHELDVESRYGKQDDFIYVRFEVQGSDKNVTDIENWQNDIIGSYDIIKAYYEEIHKMLINQVLSGYEHIDVNHSEGISVVAVKRCDVQKIAEDAFVEYMGYLDNEHGRYIETYKPQMKSYTFEKVCYGFDEEYNNTYILVKASGNSYAAMVIGVRIGDVVLRSGGIYNPFTYQYGLYDIKEDKYCDIFDVRKTPEKYNKLEENLVKYAKAYRVGDSDGDGEVSIMDATKVQLYLAGLEQLEYFDYNRTPASSETAYVSDVDNDGEVSVMDATAIQIKLANL